MSAIDRRSQDGRAVLVLGASGFVGGHVCRAFAAAGWRVAGVARTARSAALPYEIHELDLVRAEPARIAELVRRHHADVVVNAAGAVWGVTEDEMDLGNRDLVRRLVEAGPPRLIQLGSVHEYGPVSRTAITETTPTAPVTPYGRSKLAGARALLDSGADGLVLRVSNVSGPGTSPLSLLGMVAAHLASGSAEPLRLAPLLAHRDFVDVRDVADAVVRAAASGATGRVVNIGGGAAVSVRDLVGRMASADGRGVRIVEAPVAGGRPPEAEWQRMDVTLARTLLGWQPRTGLDESLHDLLSSAVRAAAPTMSASAHR
ncbi:NAD-dependent epimerase/dehydratase family protein [Streptomyces collinus]|uniref:NAD-dependent epimerase/dehydratase family protein n=1 Tax=Streptomyces collinus TaxID=42684 RepID=UPI0003FB5C5D|nr:NAD(P)-dependent oxidoreductase [Streptomyces collinus]UJA08156.1 NAD(P)-dependent oxidoreductase [Streptomyces collinus]UJA16979.1 NAD(P)-dependent oxidoreductase [Streptomyces collinus]